MPREKTRLRHISAKKIEDVETLIHMLGFKVEIKGGPVFQGGRWFVFFTVLDENAKFESVDF